MQMEASEASSNWPSGVALLAASGHSSDNWCVCKGALEGAKLFARRASRFGCSSSSSSSSPLGASEPPAPVVSTRRSPADAAAALPRVASQRSPIRLGAQCPPVAFCPLVQRLRANLGKSLDGPAHF
ncbi:unnamed protein product [Prorocentrum cordatum]|uniref:Uncharacterized protein n=1 Tax=Prorocentrum cordatum TaxID=2364126 RepID=A0ABN9SG01_9DINO|nr:unnamed protein product [Polarella glacialis]